MGLAIALHRVGSRSGSPARARRALRAAVLLGVARLGVGRSGLRPCCCSCGPPRGTAAIACDDGLDDDGDQAVDFPADDGCASASSTLENPQCSDDADNDDDHGKIDYDGGPGGGEPDPQCGGLPWRNEEKSGGCGMGFELALLLPGLWALRERARRREVRP